MSPDGWLRYWAVGWVFGPAVTIYGVAAGDWGLAFLGVVIVFLTIGMQAYWRRKATEPPSDEPAN